MDLASKELKSRIKKIILWTIIGSLIISFSVLVFLFNSGLSLFAISGSSMEPTLQDKSSIVIQKEKSIAINQIAVFDKPKSWDYMKDKDTVLIKRIAAVPGDVLEFDGKSILVNGEVSYSVDTNKYECSAGEVGYKHTLSNKEIFVMGDNAQVSLDSRRIFCDGDTENIFIPYNNIVSYGKIAIKF